jgi:multiple sugar transport system substrate-binding protein
VTSIRKSAFVAVAGLTSLGMLTACGSSSSAGKAADANAPVSITVTIDAGLQPEAIAAFDTQISQFETKYPNIKVKREEYTWTAPTFAARLAGGTLPTVFVTAFTDGRALIARKQVADISSEVAKLPYANKFNKEVIAEGQDQSGKIEMVPISAYGQALHYNRALFTEAGLDPNKPPTTWDEIRADAKQIADKTHMAGYAVMDKGNTGGWILSTESYAFGGRMSTPNGDKQTATVNNPATQQVLQMIHEMRWTDNSMGANFSYDWGGINQAFAAGKIGMYITGGGTYQNLATQNNIKKSDYGLTVIPLQGTDAGVLGGGTLAGVSAKATKAQQAAAVKWIDFYYMQKLTTEAGAVLDAKTLAEAKQPVGSPLLPVFDKATYDQVQTWIKDYIDVPLDQMTTYTTNEFNQPLIPEPPVATQDLYHALDPVVQTVLTDKNANITDLLTKANTKVQTILDKA